jgi:hypothetical protein
MGWAKRKMEEDEERGFASGNNSLICSKHFEDYALQRFIISNGKVGRCEYCDIEELEDYRGVPVVTFDALMDVIVEGITNHYGNPDDEGVGYDSREGGYMLDEIYDTYDLIRDVIMLEADDDSIVQEIIDTIGMKAWCPYNPYTLAESAELRYDWETFCKLIKHEVRFVFFRYPKKLEKDHQTLEPSYILDKIGEFIVGLGMFFKTDPPHLIVKFPLTMFRARQHSKTDQVTNCDGIGPPPTEKATNANRFSPAGISMFYGSRRKSTAIQEIIDPTKTDELITIGSFKNARPLNLIDLTSLTEISIFDLSKSKYYQPALFLMGFIESISKKIEKDGREHFEYVPTQVVTEYLRHVLPEVSGINVDGIKYKSALDGEDCYVIFANQNLCRDEGNESKETILTLEKGSLVTIAVSNVK